MVHRSILATKERIAALEAKDVLTDPHRHSVICISKMLETMCAELKVYHYEIVVGVESDEAAMQEQEFFDKHQCKCGVCGLPRRPIGETSAERSHSSFNK